MIYLTAQQVRSTRFQRAAINSFLHRRPGVVPLVGDAFRIVDSVSQEPGDLMASSVTLPPGGNAVEAYLDVVGNDDFTRESLDPIVTYGLEALARGGSNEIAWGTDGVALARFYCRATLDPQAAFEALAGAAKTLFATPTTNSPLVIVVEREPNAHVYHLDATSTQRLARLHEADWRAPRIRVSDDVHHDFDAYHGDLKEHLVDIVVGLDRDYVRGLGGVRFVDVGGKERWRWPAD